MNPKSGSPVTAVEPAEPEEVIEADVADPGEIAEIKTEQVEKKTGKYGEPVTKPHKPPMTEEEEEEKTAWIEIELIDEEDNPVPGERYEITLPDDSVAKGTLDGNGFVRIEGIEPGNCQIAFPKLDKDAWEKA
jgi:type VI secretion system secreted protein VgrG